MIFHGRKEKWVIEEEEKKNGRGRRERRVTNNNEMHMKFSRETTSDRQKHATSEYISYYF